jgi:hypothetical protein
MGITTPPPKNPSGILHTLDYDVARLFRESISEDKSLGYIPNIARAYIGRPSSQSFNERVHSAGKNVMTDKRTRLRSDRFEMLTMLQINKAFMAHAKKTIVGKHPQWEYHLASVRSSGGSIDAVDDILVDSED